MLCEYGTHFNLHDSAAVSKKEKKGINFTPILLPTESLR